MTPIEAMAVMMLVIAAGMGIHAHSESEQEVWYCFVCVGSSNKTTTGVKVDDDVQ